MRGSSPLTRGKRAQAQQGHLHVRLIPAHAGKTGRPYLGLPRPQAHPRSRGENRTEDLLVLLQLGSSPLTRGKRLRALSNKELQGLIPAHAGKTLSACRCYAGSPAHPRSRGENEGTVDKELQGLIPAHAGKTLRPPLASTPTTAHPRSRGENGRPIASHARNTGSSPLTRGKRHHIRIIPLTHGLIPAHAGKTPWYTLRQKVAAAHPRSRGENDAIQFDLEFSAGSSPLTRGKLHALMPVLPQVGLIPAHAGKTLADLPRAHARAAHPRSRGENDHVGGPAHHELGSSPLTRGKPSAATTPTPAPRLIPAHAGKT